jgi:hypothetical protein
MSLAGRIAEDIAGVLERHLPAMADPLLTAVTTLEPDVRDLVTELVTKLAELSRPENDPAAPGDTGQAETPAEDPQTPADGPEPPQEAT